MILYDSERKFFYSTLINDECFFSGFASKLLGDARQIRTLYECYRTLKIKYKKIVILEQIHSVNISVFEPKEKSEVEKVLETDGVITKLKQTIISVQTADCIPLILVDKNKGIIGISHQGWRGSLKKMAKKMVEKMSEVGSKKKDIIAAIGPSIGPCCYDVDDDLYYQFLSELDGYSDKVFHVSHGRHYLNLGYLNYLTLLDSGISKNNIDFFPFCTKCDAQRFFSFRKDGTKDFGEMLSFIIRQDRVI